MRPSHFTVSSACHVHQGPQNIDPLLFSLSPRHCILTPWILCMFSGCGGGGGGMVVVPQGAAGFAPNGQPAPSRQVDLLPSRVASRVQQVPKIIYITIIYILLEKREGLALVSYTAL